MIRRDVPAFNVATRGIAYFHVTLRTGDRDLHSGVYGGAALNAAHALVADALRPRRARRPARRAAAARASSPPTEEELAGWRELPTGADELAEQGATPADPRAAEEFYLRTFAEPALDVNGIESGSPHLQKTVLPVEAVANLSIRLAPGQKRRGDRARGRAAPARVGARRAPTLEVELWSSSPPGLVPPDVEGDPARPRRVRARRSAAGRR